MTEGVGAAVLGAPQGQEVSWGSSRGGNRQVLQVLRIQFDSDSQDYDSINGD